MSDQGVELESLLWWEKGLKWLQGQGGGQGMLRTVKILHPGDRVSSHDRLLDKIRYCEPRKNDSYGRRNK